MPEPRKATAKAAPRKATTNAKAGGAKSTAIDDLINDYIDMSQAAVKGYADLARSASKRLAGEETSKAGSWAEDATKFWGFVARDQVRAMKLMTEIMNEATKSAGKG